MSGSEHPHTENEDPSDAHHPTKKAKAPRGKSRAAPICRAVTKRSRAGKHVAAARDAPPGAGSSTLPGQLYIGMNQTREITQTTTKTPHSTGGR